MSDTRYLDWPFFEPRHVQMQRELDAWAREHVSQDAHADVDGGCGRLDRAGRRQDPASMAARGRKT